MIRASWCHTCGGGHNFGDQLTPALLGHYGYDYEWARPPDSDLVMVGSVLSKIPSSYTGRIVGTGFILPKYRRTYRDAQVLAVRGQLTRIQCALPDSTPLGDFGILAPLLAAELPQLEPRGRVWVPHYVDRRPVTGMPVLKITVAPATFVQKLRRYSAVRSSSLHALVTADALGIPHAWWPHDSVIGGSHKFNDYLSAFGNEAIVPYKMRLTPPQQMAEKAAELHDILAAL